MTQLLFQTRFNPKFVSRKTGAGSSIGMVVFFAYSRNNTTLVEQANAIERAGKSPALNPAV
jgi:hypothetical protein